MINKRFVTSLVLILLFFASSFPTLSAQVMVDTSSASKASAVPPKRKKVALVLSGGGAKGLAYIEVIKRIEKAGIPIDLVVGTSMGSIIGSLYSIGYTTEQMDSLVNSVDWSYLLTDNIKRSSLSFDKKLMKSKYLLSFPFSSDPTDFVNQGGMVKGANLANLFKQLYAEYPDSINFNDLNIPFACVATDLATHRQVNFHNGSLATAVRASMSIPGVFIPIRKDSLVLVDGGMIDNFPVDVARQMGADIVIGADVSDPLMKPYQIKGIDTILAQLINIVCQNKMVENIADTDLYIKIPMKGQTAGSFSKSGVDSIIRYGAQAADAHFDKMVALRKKIGLPEKVVPIVRPKYCLSDSGMVQVEKRDEEIKKEKGKLHTDIPLNSLNVGVRYDSEERTAFIANMTFQLGHSSPSIFSTTIRLGQLSHMEMKYIFKPMNLWEVGLRYRFAACESNLYQDGQKVVNADYIRNFAEFELGRSWKNLHIGLGINYDSYNFSDVVLKAGAISSQMLYNDKNFEYYCHLQYDNTDRRTFPTQGVKWMFSYELVSDNFISYDDEAPVSIAAYEAERSISFNSRFTLQPSLHARFMFTNHDIPIRGNYIGGDQSGRYMPMQTPFAGIRYMESVGNYYSSVSLKARQRMGENNYVFAKFSYGLHSNALKDLYDDGLTCSGLELGYAYDSLIGPLKIMVGNSNISNKTLYFSVGYVF